jgi:diaminopimelate decarboxylase
LNSLFPISAKRNNDGQVCLHDHQISQLAKQFQTPCYFYDADTFKNNINLLQDALLNNYPGKSEISYAAKAYFSEGFAEKIATQPIGLDLVSLYEMVIARNSGIDPNKVHLHGNNKSEEELRFAVEWGINAIVVDSLAELDYLETISQEYQKEIEIWFRIVPEIETETHVHIQTGHKESKFGIAEFNGQLEQAFHVARKSNFLRLEGLHAHVGSQLFEGSAYEKIFSALIKICRKYDYTPNSVSAGGGWGVAYTMDQTESSFEDWISNVCSGAQHLAKELNCSLPKLVVEPGRWLIAKSGIAVYQVGFSKFSANGTYIVAIDGGIADNLRPALYDAKYEAVICDREIGNCQTYNSTLVGRYCESGDYLIRNILLPEMKHGEFIIIPVSGAYQLSMASNYNLTLRPSVLWVEKDQISILQMRETNESSTWFKKPS